MNLSKSHKIVDAHLLKYFDNNEFMIFHEKESQYFHLDIYWIKPNESRNYNILLTNGISSQPFNTPDKNLTKYIELCILLPPDWVSDNNWKQPEKNWPITLLSSTGRYPFQNKTWLGFSHTIETGYLLPGTNFEGIILLKSTMLPTDFQKIDYKENNIEIYTVFPLYMNELNFVRNNNLKDLMELFDKEKFNDIVNINRKNVCDK